MDLKELKNFISQMDEETLTSLLGTGSETVSSSLARIGEQDSEVGMSTSDMVGEHDVLVSLGLYAT